MSGPFNINNIGGIRALSIKPKVNAPLVTQVANNGVNATGAGITYTVTGPCILVFLSLQGLTTNDTIYTLTCDGVVVSQQTTTFAGTDIAIVNTGFSVSTAITATASAINTPIRCETGFSFFVKTTADSSISVLFNYLELNQ